MNGAFTSPLPLTQTYPHYNLHAASYACDVIPFIDIPLSFPETGGGDTFHPTFPASIPSPSSGG